MSQTSHLKNHGDDKEMLMARRDFLHLGCYDPLCNELNRVIAKYFDVNATLLDAGCGEGYYTEKIFNSLVEKGLKPNVLAVDISKNALDLLNNKDVHFKRGVASVFSLPIEKKSVDILLNVFAPYCFSEYKRVLKKGGIMILAIPLERHLFSLKSAVYEKPYKNEVSDTEINGFEFIEKNDVKYNFKLKSNEEIMNLFKMTPYYHKTAPNDLEKLNILNELEIEGEFGVLVYKNK